MACRCLTSERVTDKCHAKVATFPSPQRKFANLGARRDHWVHCCWRQPSRCSLPQCQKGFRPSMKDASRLSCLLLQLGSNDGEASLPEKGATEATSCPKGGTMWRHWYGLTQAWGSTTYDWTLGQILPRSREEGCQQGLTESSVKGKTRVYREGNLTVEEYTYGITRGESKPYGHLAEYRGWPETRASKHKYWAWRQTAPPSLTAGGAGGLHQGSPSGELNWRRKQALVSPGEGEWRSKRDTGQFFPPLTCYPTHGKKLAQRRDCRISRRCSVSPSPQLYRCLPERRRAPTHRTRQHSVWSEPSPPWGTARLGIGTPRRWHPLSSGPTSAWRQPSLSADHRNRQGAAQSFWSSGCGPRICAMLLRDTATPRLGLPPPKAVLAGSPPDRGRAWWEPWARIQAGVSGQRESSPAQTQGTLRSPKMLGGPWPSDGSECGQERCLSRQVSATYLFP